MDTLATFYHLKENRVVKPSVYLEAQIREHRLPDNTGKLMWNISAEIYLEEAACSLEAILLKEDKRLPTKVITPLLNNYHPEMDVSPLLDQPHHTLYMHLMGLLHWAAELG
jgi:hypothetical protein